MAKSPLCTSAVLMAAKGVGAGRVPDAALGREALVGYPDVGAEVFNLIVFCNRLGIADHLENHDILALGQDKGLLFAEGGVEFLVQPDAVLVHELAFGFATAEFHQFVPAYE